ncbi:MAG: hypothetical protein ABIQ12_01075 [Opitutaceae bacterium]
MTGREPRQFHQLSQHSGETFPRPMEHSREFRSFGFDHIRLVEQVCRETNAKAITREIMDVLIDEGSARAFDLNDARPQPREVAHLPRGAAMRSGQ